MISGKLAELYVDLVAHDRLAPALSAASDRVARLRADLAAVGTTGWTQGIQQFVALQKQANEEQKKLARQFDIATLGTFGTLMKDMREGFAKFAEQLEGLGGKFPIAIAGMTGLVGAASPDAFTTFTMSLRLLAASIGVALLPAFVEIIRWIQRAARWFMSLDDETKRLIGTVALWVAGLSAAAFILARLIGLATSLFGVLRAIGMLSPIGMLLGGMAALLGGGLLSRAGVPGFGGEGSTGPSIGTGLGLAATTFGAARMGAGWASIPATAPLWAAYAMSGRGGIGEGFSRFMTRAFHPDAPGARPEGVYRSTLRGLVEDDRTEYGGIGGAEFASGFTRRLRPATDDEASRLGLDSADVERARDTAAAAARAAELLTTGRFDEASRVLGGIGRPFEDTTTEDARSRIWSAFIRGGLPAAEAAREEARPSIVASTRPGGAAAAATSVGGVAGGAGDAIALATNFQSQFLGIEQQWKRLQTEAASDSPLAAEMREIAARSLERLVELAGYTREIRDRPGGLGR